MSESSTSSSSALPVAYYNNVEFASQLCEEMARLPIEDDGTIHLTNARDQLQRLLASHPRSTAKDQLTSAQEPAWPRHEFLIRFDHPLHRLTGEEWKSAFYVLRAGRLYHCDGCNGHADSHEGVLAFMRSKPALDGHYCIKVGKSHGAEVCSVECCSQPVKGQSFVFNIKFNAHPAWAGGDTPRDVFLAAADDVTRQRCVQALRAAIADISVSYDPRNIAFTVAVTPDLIAKQNLSTLKSAVAIFSGAYFCNDWSKIGAKTLRQAGLTTEELRGIGFKCPGCSGRLTTTDRDPDTGEYFTCPCFTCKGTGNWERDA
jgi:hypothetical protein